MGLLAIIVVVIMVVLGSIGTEDSGLVCHDDSLRRLKEEEHVLGRSAGEEGRLVESQNSLH